MYSLVMLAAEIKTLLATHSASPKHTLLTLLLLHTDRVRQGRAPKLTHNTMEKHTFNSVVHTPPIAQESRRNAL